MKSAADLLKAKAHQSVFTITPTASVFEAVKPVSEKNIGALLGMEGEEIAGIIPERDDTRRCRVPNASRCWSTRATRCPARDCEATRRAKGY